MAGVRRSGAGAGAGDGAADDNNTSLEGKLRLDTAAVISLATYHPTESEVATPRLRIAEIEGKGRCVFAATDLKAGDIVCANAPLAACLLPERRTTHCSACFERASEGAALSKCAKCKVMRYCTSVRRERV